MINADYKEELQYQQKAYLRLSNGDPETYRSYFGYVGKTLSQIKKNERKKSYQEEYLESEQVIIEAQRDNYFVPDEDEELRVQPPREATHTVAQNEDVIDVDKYEYNDTNSNDLNYNESDQ